MSNPKAAAAAPAPEGELNERSASVEAAQTPIESPSEEVAASTIIEVIDNTAAPAEAEVREVEIETRKLDRGIVLETYR